MACINNLADIERQCDITLGFEAQVFAAAIDDIDSMPAAVDGAIATITMKAGKTFAKIPISTEAGKNKLNCTQTGDSDGSAYDNKLTVFSPGITATKNAIIGNLRKPIGYVFIIVDKDGLKHILGTSTDGATVNVTAEIDAGKGHTIVATHLSKSLPIIYSGVIPRPV